MPDPLHRLEAAAQSWVGTPFCERSAVKGAGVCCHLLPYAILREAGWLPELDVPRALAPHTGHAGGVNLIAEWMAGPGAGHFYGPGAASSREPGDILCFRPLRRIHHCALALPGGRIIHVLDGHGVRILDELPARWAERLESVWRVGAASSREP